MKRIYKKIISAIIEFESKLVLRTYRPKIVAVTGSVGKTSTKDAIFSVMSGSFHVRKSEKSFNSDIGIPLTVLGCGNGWTNPFLWIRNIFAGFGLIIFRRPYPEWLVLEVGADRPGDIRKAASWIRPDIAVVTAFAKVPVHVEFFAGREAVIREKKYLVEALKHNGVLVANGDDDDVMRMRAESPNRAIVYGTDGVADLIGSDAAAHYGADGRPDGMTFKVTYGNNVVPIVIRGSLGRQNMYAALAALAAGSAAGINLVKAAEGLLDHATPKGRMRIIPGLKNTTVIDDTYNSSPVAARSALAALAEVKTAGRKIAALGDMLELGKHSAEEHADIGAAAASAADILVTVGIRSRTTAEAALDAGMADDAVLQFDTAADAADEVARLLRPGDIVLVKGSQSMRMERIVKALMAEPERAPDLLVRQEEEWRKR